MGKSPGVRANYQAPALEKGLDILECLADQGTPLTQAQLARALGKGANELYRMLICLEQRRYIQRDPVSGAYRLTLRLFELSHTHSPWEGLMRAARQPMRELAEKAGESCHLSVLHAGNLLVLAQEESPQQLRISVEVGRAFPLLHTVSGRLLLAYKSGPDVEEILQLDPEASQLNAVRKAALMQRLNTIRTRGYEEAYSETWEGIRDFAVLVGSPCGSIQSALAIPHLAPKKKQGNTDLLPAIQPCAQEIGRAAGLLV